MAQPSGAPTPSRGVGAPVSPRSLRALWLLVQEPRAVTVIQTVEYLIVMVAGALAIAAPPRSIVEVIGTPLMDLTGALLLVGGALAAVGTPRGYWWVERVGILAAVGGLVVYAVVVGSLQASESGNRGFQLAIIAVGIVSLVKRFARIWRYQYDPER